MRSPVPSRHLRPSHPLCLLALALCLAPAGCSGGGSNNSISGNITFDGKPVPTGRIYFTPDPAKKTKSPAGFAEINGGSYDTSKKGGRGVAPGSFIVRIEGFDGQATDQFSLGKPIFVYQTKAEITSDDTKLDFQVPAAAAKNVPPTEGPPP